MTADRITELFWGRNLVIATMHGKEKVLAPLLEEALWVTTFVPSDYNTDAFWTFSWEIERTGNQLEAARAKLLWALSLTWETLWVATEGSFWADPSMPFLHSHRELVMLIDLKNNFEILGHFRSFETNLAWEYVENSQEIDAFLEKIGFPEHKVILRRKEKSTSGLQKNISTKQELFEAVKTLQKKSFFSKKVYLETDMRAMHNPTRMYGIKEACKNLIENINSLCPSCKTPGFILREYISGLPCEWCQRPTTLPLAEIRVCSSCGYREQNPSQKYGTIADPGNCEYCNP